MSSFWEGASRSATLEFSNYFMEPEPSVPCSQEPFTDPYCEPDQSSLYHPILSL
jgi:hypothetical protein